jgi:aspartokinase
MTPLREVLFVNDMNKVCWEESGQKLASFLEKAEGKYMYICIYLYMYYYYHTNTNTTIIGEFASDPSYKGMDVPMPHLLITGFVATTLDGVATTLKRDGSDYSASIFGKMLQATTITIWTDVSGVFSADPRR